MFDWQAVVVALVVLAALLYTARRALARLRSFATGRRGADASCATGCGKCGDEDAPRPDLIQISTQRTPSPRRRRP